MAPSESSTVRRIRAEEGSVLRALRRSAVASDPLAFASTLEQEEAHPDALWDERARSGASSDSSAIFVAESNGRPPHGMVGAFTHEGSRFLWGMWVAPTRRGEGTGEALLAVVLAWCHDHPAEKPVRLDVNPTQVAAIHLYERHGFVWDGEERPLGHHPPAMRRGMRRAGSDPANEEGP
ncbi:MAG TPA: GNAT family N-acetyltransferase [Thermoplasmata archaeon]|jgi:GNAT superfamily N-acetyltransferase|nr:GNAT family N-acetyltransferase [Thermoplasmata archaeon]